ncbi:hypothetical protein G5714_004533 [Onychostoma macrolepis]|uniref:Uncharacterized protein n=1 Tax=Onychostoma macrolepis TaxID=369639 RepID=A0A7J6D4Z1_9TELE|nr:hypothetical protein G5714_004533 [Onychostoma macrolepis]
MKARSEVEPSTHTLSQSEVRDLEKVAPKKDQLPLDQDCVEKMSLVKEHVLNEEQSFCAPAEGVKEGGDIQDPKDLFNVLQDTTSSIKYFWIDETEVSKYDEAVPNELPLVKGTLKIHQIVADTPGKIHHRELSCFCSRINATCECGPSVQIDFQTIQEVSGTNTEASVTLEPDDDLSGKFVVVLCDGKPFVGQVLRAEVCSSFWHKSCYSKLHEWNGKQLSWEVSSEEDELSDEEYIPQSESDNQSDSSDELTTRPACYDQANLLSDIQEAASYKFSEPQRSDVTALNVSKGKGKGVLKAREAASVYDESDLLCHEEQLIDVETDSDSDCSDEIRMTDSDDSDPEESDSDDDALARAAGDSSNAGMSTKLLFQYNQSQKLYSISVQKMPIESATEVPKGTRGLNCSTTINDIGKGVSP